MSMAKPSLFSHFSVTKVTEQQQVEIGSACNKGYTQLHFRPDLGCAVAHLGCGNRAELGKNITT